MELWTALSGPRQTGGGMKGGERERCNGLQREKRREEKRREEKRREKKELK